jgi:hypothetical protein
MNKKKKLKLRRKWERKREEQELAECCAGITCYAPFGACASIDQSIEQTTDKANKE